MIFIAYPFAAFVVAAGFALLARARGSRAARVAAWSWAAYGAYEYLMHARVLCSGECNIRVDLLLFYPLLLIASLWALVAALHRRRPEPPSRQD